MAWVADGTTEAAAWKPDGAELDPAADAWVPDGAATHDGFAAPDGAAPEDDYNDGYVGKNISKHAADPAGADDHSCRICHAEGHFARDCPERDNPNREFTGTCRICEQVGHRAAQCPSKPPSKCKICLKEGHLAADCSENRLLAGLATDDVIDADTAWQNLLTADGTKDTDDIKTAILTYARCLPTLTFSDLEEGLRAMKCNTHLIAKEQEIPVTHTIVNLQGQAGLKYVISIQFTAQPRRAKFADGWPKSAEENLARIPEAGWLVDSMVRLCFRCGKPGHTTRECEQAPMERAPLVCATCGSEAHRARDCTEERRSSRKPQVCRNCDQEGHKASECTEPAKCRNCDEVGHVSKECPKPTDWSRVECRTCHEKGHSAKRCPQGPPPETDEAPEAGNDGGYATAAGGRGGDDPWAKSVLKTAKEDSGHVASDGGWGTGANADVTVGGDGGW